MTKVIYFFVVIFSFAFCNKEPEQRSNLKKIESDFNAIELIKVGELTISDARFQIGRIEAPMLVSNYKGEKIFVFYDTGLNQVIITDTLGKFKQTIGKYGSGPDEFNHITSIGVDGDSLIVYDGTLDKVKTFSMDGELIEIYDGLIQDNIWPRSKRLFPVNNYFYYGIQEARYSGSNNHWKSSTIAEYDKSGNLMSVFGEYDPSLVKSHILYNYTDIVLSDDGFVYSTHRTSYQIQKIYLQEKRIVSQFGTQTESFKISDERPNPNDPRSRKNEINTKFSFVGDSYITKDYFLFSFFNYTESYWELRDPNDKENYFYVYNKKDEFLGEIALDYYPLCADEDGNIYLLEDDNPDNFIIGVYNIVQ